MRLRVVAIAAARASYVDSAFNYCSMDAGSLNKGSLVGFYIRTAVYHRGRLHATDGVLLGSFGPLVRRPDRYIRETKFKAQVEVPARAD